ncbi:hypothetical protein SK128_020347 [Halocaridina rubra]|uniref:Aminotransferase class I/classII domain-containing protein n=1 Tax=Halocaridina rubra TaxID=373956 RepID=A0AAN8XTN6_HALRR
MRETLQYNKTNGYPPLVKHLQRLIQHLHNPPKWSDREVMVTNGSLEGLGRVFEIILDNGDFVIIPEHCYQGVFVATKHTQPNYIPVKSDHDGLIVECLQDAILNCRSKGGSPKVSRIIADTIHSPNTLQS